MKQANREKNPAAVALGRLGGKKGAEARNKSLTAEQRREIARKASQARMKVLTPEDRTRVAKAAAAARWKKHPMEKGGK